SESPHTQIGAALESFRTAGQSSHGSQDTEISGIVWSRTPRGAAVLIAYRRLIITGPSGDTEVPVRLFQPENDEGMWICRYEIDWPSQKRSHFGVDSFQAADSRAADDRCRDICECVS